ncbi:MAG: PAS domain S-box protein [bacterium]|nr:PAS domain S-box protein [bacterium]
MSETQSREQELREELEALQRRLMELEEIEVMRVSEEHDRFDSLQVLDEYAKQLEDSRDKLARLLRAGTAVQEARSIKEILQLVANAVGQAGWSSVSVIIFENWDITESAYYGCTPEEIVYLETHRQPPERRAEHFGPEMDRFRVSRSYFIPADSLQEIMSPDQVVPGRRTPEPGDTWDVMDLAYVPLQGSEGKIIGSINCDDPINGQRPTAETFFYLELFADLAARKVEAMQMQERQQHMEEALRQSEVKYRNTFNRSADGFFLMDELFRDCNSKACELWRCEPEDIIGHSPSKFSPEFQPDGRRSEIAANEYIHAAMRGDPQVFYWMHKRKDDTLMDCEVSLASMQIGDKSQVLAIVRDISERKRDELEQIVMLRVLQIGTTSDTQDEMIRGIFQQVGRLVPVENYFLALHDAQTNLIEFPIFVDEADPPPEPRPFGNALTEWVIRNGKPLCLNPDQCLELERRGEAKVHGTPAASWLGVPLISQSKSFGALVVQSYRTVNLFTDYHVRVFSAVAAQISSVIARSRSEQQLRTLQKAVESSGEIVFMTDPNGTINFVNSEFSRFYGYRPEEIVGKKTIEILCRDIADVNGGGDLLARLQKGEIVRGQYRRNRTKDGGSVDVECSASPVLDEHKRMAGILYIQRNVGQRLLEERALRESEEGLRWLVDNFSDAVSIVDMDDTFEYVNAATEELFGVPSGTLVGRNFKEFLSPEQFAIVRRNTQTRYEGVRNHYICEIQRLDGEIRTVQIAATPRYDRDGMVRRVLATYKEISPSLNRNP